MNFLCLDELKGFSQVDIITHVEDTFNIRLKRNEFFLISKEYNDYQSENYFLFIDNGKLYENYAYHGSCYGFDGQWEPEMVSLDSVIGYLKFIINSEYNYDDNNEIMMKFLEKNKDDIIENIHQ